VQSSNIRLASDSQLDAKKRISRFVLPLYNFVMLVALIPLIKCLPSYL
jgi:hypothetical protein